MTIAYYTILRVYASNAACCGNMALLLSTFRYRQAIA